MKSMIIPILPESVKTFSEWTANMIDGSFPESNLLCEEWMEFTLHPFLVPD